MQAQDDWISAIPTGWKSLPLKRVASIESSGSYGDEEGVLDRDLPVCTTATVLANGEFNFEKMPIRSFSEKDVERYAVQPKDILVVKSSGSATNIISGKSAQVDENRYGFVYTNFLMRIRATNIESDYLSHFLKSGLVVERIKRMVSTTTYPNISVPLYSMQAIFFPSKIKQQKIADFLDQETAKIDNLIAKQERLLELLEEKRRATITHAVTRGLDPHVELKETNIPWLGQIPAHWNMKRVSAVYQRKSVRNFPNEELLSVYRDHGVIPKSSRDDNHNTESEDLSKYQLVEINDLVTNKMKTWQGSIAVSAVRGIVSPAYFIFRPYNNDMLPKFVHHLLRSDRYIAQYKSISKGIRPGQWDLDIDQFKIMKLTVPPLVEQQDIVNAIELNEKKTSHIKQKIQTQITLLRERRTSLISHAVTGKVKI